MRILHIFLPLFLLAGCAAGAPDRFQIEPVALSKSVTTGARSISVMPISLPAYAKESGIYVQNETGAIVAIPKADWADETERAMRLYLVRSLGDITGAEVASDPWPLGGIPEAEIRVDVQQMLVDNGNVMRLTGQFSIRRDAAFERSRIRQFSITAPARSNEPSAVVEAHGDAWQELAREIAEAL